MRHEIAAEQEASSASVRIHQRELVHLEAKRRIHEPQGLISGDVRRGHERIAPGNGQRGLAEWDALQHGATDVTIRYQAEERAFAVAHQQGTGPCPVELSDR
jgi:hypothetical protein